MNFFAVFIFRLIFSRTELNRAEKKKQQQKSIANSQNVKAQFI